MRIASILSSTVLIISFLSGCCTTCNKKVEDQARLLSEKEALISQLERKQKNSEVKLAEEDARRKNLEAKLTENDAFVQELRKEIGALEDNKQILVKQIEDKTFITMANAILFASGSANLSEQGIEALKPIGNVLEKYPDRSFCIEGHTDNVPFAAEQREKYSTNWELSTSRAIQVMNYMVGHFKIEENRLSVKGYGPFKPVAPNDTPEGRANNRRVVIVVDSKTS